MNKIESNIKLVMKTIRKQIEEAEQKSNLQSLMSKMKEPYEVEGDISFSP